MRTFAKTQMLKIFPQKENLMQTFKNQIHTNIWQTKKYFFSPSGTIQKLAGGA